MLQSEDHSKKWPTNAQIGYGTPTARAVSKGSEWGTQLEVAHKWAHRAHHPCRLGVLNAAKRSTQPEMAH